MSIELVMPCNHLTLCHSLLLPSVFASVRVYSSESVLCIPLPKYWSFNSSISPPVNFQDWFPFPSLISLQSRGLSIKSLLQDRSSKASILWRLAFFMIQLSDEYMTTGKTIAVTRWNFVAKVMSLLFNMVSRLVIAFLSRINHLLISRLIFIPWSDRTRCHDIQFSSVQFSSVAQSCPTPCNPMNRSMPGLPVHHQLPELTQTHVHRVRDAIQPSHPLSSPSPPVPNPSQHHSLFQWVNSSHEWPK